MNESSRTVFDTETPVNPYSLLEAVNRSSDTANAAWLIYIALMSYLLITVAGISHKDLLLNSDIALPILQVKIELTRFFLFAPILLVLLHLGVISQLVLLARKTLEFAASIRMLETTDQRTHPLRLELDNFFFVQAIAGPERSRDGGHVPARDFLAHAGAAAGDAAALRAGRVPALPRRRHHLGAPSRRDGRHRAAGAGGRVPAARGTSFFRAFWGTSRHHPLGLLVTAGLLAAVAFVSLFVATIPGEPIDRYASALDRRADGGTRRIFGFALPAFGTAADGSLLGPFQRNLNVADLDFVVDKDVTPNEPSLNLRGRDLRFAKLDRTDLHQADFTGADLEGASLAGADLRNVTMACADLNELLLTGDRRAARCVNARGANLARARLTDARMAGIDLTGARLEEAQLQGVELAHGLMAGANFAGARLDRADLSGDAWLQGANFLLASLQGADLAGAKLQMADFRSASMQGANLSLASLEGALLRDAELEGANLQMARLTGADMSGAKVQGGDLTGAVVWRTLPPSGESSAFSDMGQVIIRAPAAEELAELKMSLGRINGALGTRLAEGLTPLLDAAQNAGWASSPDQQMWQGFATASETAAAEGYKGRLSEYLAKLMCRSRYANASVATGIARRAVGQGFKGDAALIYERLRGADCPASAAMTPRAMRELAGAADLARGQ